MNYVYLRIYLTGVAVLKKMAGAPVPFVVENSMSGQKPPHDCCNGNRTGFYQQMKMIGDKGPCQTAGFSSLNNCPEPVQKIIAVCVVFKDFGPLNSPHYDVM